MVNGDLQLPSSVAVGMFDLFQFLLGYYHAGWAKKRATLLLSISLPIIDQFSKSFPWHYRHIRAH